MTPIIELKNIFYEYVGEENTLALNDLSYQIFEGEWVAIIGHNGSGKSTQAKIINGLLEAKSGEVFIEGERLSVENVWDLRAKVGMVFQNPDNQFVGSTVEDDVAFGLENHGIPREEMLIRVENALREVRMEEFKTKEPARLSGGQKQRVAIAGIVALSPSIIILDEATSMLDPEGRNEVISTIQKIKREKNLTVLSITHDIDEAANADRILVMKQGRLVDEGTPEQIFSKGEQLVELGLELPFAERLKLALKQRGVPVPSEYMSEERLVEFWISNLKK
ncbi:energy-coupling factor transport system ATP-binding protein [Pilibacter termitis]|uniref:Energy-coupling factor transport system ATP-binding protein n=1 Tax=Pilibacter termitis TaxID=263852 RepID=A0A1T4L1K1_9ENTE|nr:energy-coupling factor ABC transporter ATP-binding protein [Pilibacter termitis]SJZ48468.1 energy-coupling factor transport system ATP-binding protein [Pilibacter termitis]